MNQYQEIMGKVNYGLFLVVAALLPFPQIALRIAGVLWIISWFMEGRWLTRPRSLRENKTAIPFLLFGAWYVWKALSGLWAADIGSWAWQMERYMAFGLMVPVGIWGVNRRYDWRQAAKVLIVSCVAAVPIYLIAITVLYHHREIVDLIQWEGEWDYSKQSWLSFVDVNLSVLKHRLFLCSVELLGIVLAFRLLRHRPKVLLPAVAVMFAFVLLTASRQTVLTTAVLIAVALVYDLPRRLRLRYGLGILAAGIVVGWGVLTFHPRMQDFNYSAVTEIRQISDKHDIRFNIWGAALQSPSDYLWHGIGAGQSTDYISARLQAAHYSYEGKDRYHCHNQYLEECMEIGVFGLLLFLIAWLSIPVCANSKGRKTALLLTALFMMNMLTDCMFGKFDGIVLWAVGLLFICLQSGVTGKAVSSPRATA